MSNTGRLFIAGIWLVGLVAGLVLMRTPDLPLPVPALTIPLAAALLLDLVLMVPALRAGRLGQITMQDRMIGVVGGSLIVIALTAMGGALKRPCDASSLRAQPSNLVDYWNGCNRRAGGNAIFTAALYPRGEMPPASEPRGDRCRKR